MTPYVEVTALPATQVTPPTTVAVLLYTPPANLDIIPEGGAGGAWSASDISPSEGLASLLLSIFEEKKHTF